MPRGGRRTGAPGTAYSNRTDLNPAVPIKAAPGQQYGAAKAQIEAQRAVPIARPATDVVTPMRTGGPEASSPASGPPVPLPGQLMPLDAPSQRPGEPVTAGLPVGPGAGPEALGPLAGGGEDVGMQLRAIYSRFPNEDLRSLLELLDEE